jgi:hypothetical protein
MLTGRGCSVPAGTWNQVPWTCGDNPPSFQETISMDRNYLLYGIIGAAVIVIAAVAAGGVMPHEPAIPVVCIVYGSEKGDLSYTDSAYRGLAAAQHDLSVTTKEFTPRDYQTFRNFSTEAADRKNRVLSSRSVSSTPILPGILQNNTPGYGFLPSTSQVPDRVISRRPRSHPTATVTLPVSLRQRQQRPAGSGSSWV